MKINIPERIANSLINAGAVQPEDKAIYEYGIKQGIFLVINVSTAVLIGLLMGMVLECIIFLIAYNPVRTYAGGYHAGTQLSCYMLSIPMVVAVLLGIKLLPWGNGLLVTVLLCAVIIIGLYAPVEDRNKPLNDREKTVYKKVACIYTLVLSGATVLLWFVGMKHSSLSIVMALAVAAVMLILGAFKNRYHKEEKA